MPTTQTGERPRRLRFRPGLAEASSLGSRLQARAGGPEVAESTNEALGRRSATPASHDPCFSRLESASHSSTETQSHRIEQPGPRSHHTTSWPSPGSQVSPCPAPGASPVILSTQWHLLSPSEYL